MSLFASSKSQSIAVRITNSEVTVLKFNPQTRKIVGLYRQPLVQTTAKSLEAGIIQAVSASKILADQVSVGIPENKTFTTTLNIAKVPINDLDEAVNWQAEEILPSPVNTVYFDWKRINPPKASKPPPQINKLLLTSAPKSLVDPIINSLIKAGVKPLSCEPTSISLSRLAPQGELALIAEIRKTDSTVILVDKLSTPILSTVIPQPSAFTSEVNKLLSFYVNKTKLKPTTIYICGQGITPQWQKYLTDQIHLKVAPLNLPDIANPSPDLLNFAVSISLAIKAPSPPKDPRTINLLPKDLEEKYLENAEKTTITSVFKLVVSALSLTAIVMFMGFISLKLSAQKLSDQIALRESAAGQTQYSQAAKQAELANTQARILNHLPPQDNIVNLLADLQASLNSGISLNNYLLDLSEKALLINGFAAKRDDLLQFKANLETKTSFNLVTIPLPTLENKQNINFSIAVDLGASK